jgi:chromosome partitioning protein
MIGEDSLDQVGRLKLSGKFKQRLEANPSLLRNRRKQMKVVVVANPKGGAGKSTLSTNIAGYFASRGHAVMLGDADTQQSSRLWLQQRPDTHVVIDTPGGMHGWRLKEVIQRAHKVIIPVMPSVFDMSATSRFLVELKEIAASLPTQIRVVGNRVDARTISAAKLHQFTDSLDVQVLTHLRDTQYYLHMAAHGLSLFDMTPSKVPKDLEQWAPICEWLDQ